MRTSKISQETSRIFNTISPNTRAGSTRSSKRFASFALRHHRQSEPTDDINSKKGRSVRTRSPESPAVEDIEDALGTTPQPRKKRRLSPSPTTTAAVIKQETETTAADSDDAKPASRAGSKSRSKPKRSARKVTDRATGKVTVQPPEDWEEIYGIVQAMREANPTAPVDTMGCEDLFWRSAPAHERRYHTLVSLMLSSQTKDTVTAAAMKRLHTELAGPPAAADNDVPWDPATGGGLGRGALPSQLTVANMLACTPAHLDSLIGKVGFHNTKTKHLQATAAILKEKHGGDIPRSAAELVALPGVGPKMAYLCLSAAWGEDAGIGVDVHVHRITNRWGWHDTRTPEETRAALEAWLPRDKWHHINRMLVGLGQTVCLPVGRRCDECDLAGRGLCKSEVAVGRKARQDAVRKKEEEEADGDAMSSAAVRVKVEPVGV